MTYPIAHAVGDNYAHDFKSIRLRTTDRLLDRGAAPKGREDIATQIGLPTSTILDFVNIADLMRIKNLGMKYIKLLRHVGVATVRQLRYRNAANLYDEMAAANATEHFVDFLPPQKFVARWIEQAKQLEIKVTYR